MPFEVASVELRIIVVFEDTGRWHETLLANLGLKTFIFWLILIIVKVLEVLSFVKLWLGSAKRSYVLLSCYLLAPIYFLVMGFIDSDVAGKNSCCHTVINSWLVHVYSWWKRDIY